MKIRPTGTAYFLMVIFIVLLVFLLVSLTYTEFRTKFMPVLVSAITLVLTIIALIQEFSGSTISDEINKQPAGGKPKKKDAPLSSYLNAFGWLLLLIAGVYIFGFLIATPIWIFYYLYRQGHRWWSAILQGAAAILLAYLVFVALLHVHFYPGLTWLFLKSHLSL